MNITADIRYIGVNDRTIDLFEGQYRVPKGMCYNSYMIMDDEIAIFDTVDARFTHEWLDNIERELGKRKPNYLVIQHMEPDHSANIAAFMDVYPNTYIVSSSKAFAMMKQFFGKDYEENQIVIADGNQLSLGRHTLHFVGAPMAGLVSLPLIFDITSLLFSLLNTSAIKSPFFK